MWFQIPFSSLSVELLKELGGPPHLMSMAFGFVFTSVLVDKVVCHRKLACAGLHCANQQILDVGDSNREMNASR